MAATTTRTITLTVDADFHDEWLETVASREERTAALRFVVALPRVLPAVKTDDTLLKTLVERVLSETHSRDAARVRELELELAHQSARARANDGCSAEDQLRWKNEIAALQKQYSDLGQKKTESEQRLTDKLQDQLNCILGLTREKDALRAEVQELRTPAGRGRTGEWAVIDALEALGFDVEDTSMGVKKDEGYHDLLVRTPDVPDLRIAVECKNKERIDTTADLKSFADKTRAGIARGLFDTAIFVSIRAHTKKHKAHVVELFHASDGNATIPVTYVGPERGRDAAPLSQEALQSHVCMHIAFAVQCRQMRATLSQCAHDAAVPEEAQHTVRALLERVRAETAARMDDLNQQQKLLTQMQTQLRDSRVRCIQHAVALSNAHCATAWIGPLVQEFPWMAEFHHVQDKLRHGTSDRDVWKNLSEVQKKRINDHTGGKDVFFKAARVERSADDESECS